MKNGYNKESFYRGLGLALPLKGAVLVKAEEIKHGSKNNA
jgi:hypothetical protein